MFLYSLIFLVAAAAAAWIGFSGVAPSAAWIARIFAGMFAALSVLAFLAGRGNPPPTNDRRDS